MANILVLYEHKNDELLLKMQIKMKTVLMSITTIISVIIGIVLVYFFKMALRYVDYINDGILVHTR